MADFRQALKWIQEDIEINGDYELFEKTKRLKFNQNLTKFYCHECYQDFAIKVDNCGAINLHYELIYCPCCGVILK